MIEEQLILEMEELIEAQTEAQADSGSDPDTKANAIALIIEMGRRHPTLTFPDLKRISHTAHLRVAFRFQEEAEKMQALMDSPAGQLMKENPEMTFAQAMEQCGHWPTES